MCVFFPAFEKAIKNYLIKKHFSRAFWGVCRVLSSIVEWKFSRAWLQPQVATYFPRSRPSHHCRGSSSGTNSVHNWLELRGNLAQSQKTNWRRFPAVYKSLKHLENREDSVWLAINVCRTRPSKHQVASANVSIPFLTQQMRFFFFFIKSSTSSSSCHLFRRDFFLGIQ